MKEIVGHPNVIRLHGASTTGHGTSDHTLTLALHDLTNWSSFQMWRQGPIMVITEYVPNGTLQEFLRKSRSADRQYSPSDSSYLKASSILSPSELLTFALQIAKGMQHLALMKVTNSNK